MALMRRTWQLSSSDDQPWDGVTQLGDTQRSSVDADECQRFGRICREPFGVAVIS